jgi:hypothetical protein
MFCYTVPYPGYRVGCHDMPEPVPPERRTKPHRKKSRQAAELDRKFRLLKILLVVLGVIVIVGIGVAVHAFMSNGDVQEARPNLVNNRPPEFSSPVICDLKSGINSSVRAYIRNIGDARATNVIETIALHLVPDKTVGNPEFDNIPQGDCKTKSSAKPFTLSMDSGEENTPLLSARLLKMPPLLNGEAAHLYGTSCFYYSDPFGKQHISCETRRFIPADGTPVFMCDNTPKPGTFDSQPLNNCAN